MSIIKQTVSALSHSPCHLILRLLRGAGGLGNGFIGLCFIALLGIVRLLLRIEDHPLLLSEAIDADTIVSLYKPETP